MRWTAAAFAPACIKSDAVVCRRSWNRIGRTFAMGQSFGFFLPCCVGQRRTPPSAAISE
ncbi:MAG TPA: hypothetical protein VGH28_28260 [Polyangiaceae bacterium]